MIAKKTLVAIFLVSFVFICSVCTFVVVNIGGGTSLIEDFPMNHSLTSLSIVSEFDQPPGNVAVNSDGVIAICFHPEAKPSPKVILIRDGDKIKLPDDWFETVMSLRFDSEGFLWTLDHGLFGFKKPRLLKIDIKKLQVVKEIELRNSSAPIGSNLNDFQLDSSRKLAFIADTSFIRNSPAIVVVNLETGDAIRKLEKDPSVSRGAFAVTVNGEMIGFPPFLTMRPAIDSIVLDRKGKWLYFGAMSSTKLFRILVKDLIDSDLTLDHLSKKVHEYAQKPLSDGLAIDEKDIIYVTEVQGNAIGVINPVDRSYSRIVVDSKLEWPDGMSFGTKNDIYVTASYLHHVAFNFSKSWKKRGPFRIFKFATLPGGFSQI